MSATWASDTLAWKCKLLHFANSSSVIHITIKGVFTSTQQVYSWESFPDKYQHMYLKNHVFIVADRMK